MTCCSVDNKANIVGWVGLTFLAVSAITLIVIAILGSTGVMHLAPTSADWMFSVGASAILIMLIGVIKVCCHKKSL